ADRHHRHRERLLAAGARPARPAGDQQSRPAGRPGPCRALRRHRRDRQLRRRSRLWLHRSEIAGRPMRPALPANFLIGAVLVGLVVAMAILSLVWTPHPYDTIDVARRFLPPSSENWLGTDQLGRDVLSQLMVGARSSVSIAIAAVLLGGSIGTMLGLTAAASGGVIDDVILRLA